MPIDTGNTRIAVVKEAPATPGVTPATPAFMVVDHLPGSQIIQMSDPLVSNTRVASRASAGSTQVNFRGEGQLNVEFKRDAAFEALLEGALSGTWTTNVLKAGSTLQSFTIEETFYEGSSPRFRRATGAYVGFSLSAEFGSYATVEFPVTAISSTRPPTAITGSTYTAASTKPLIAGSNISGISVGTLTGVVPTAFSLTVETNREVKGGFSSVGAAFIGTGRRNISGSLTFLVNDLSGIDLTNTNVPISFTLGTGVGNAYTFLIPNASIQQVTTGEDGTAMFIEVPFTAGPDTTAGTDLQITRN